MHICKYNSYVYRRPSPAYEFTLSVVIQLAVMELEGAEVPKTGPGCWGAYRGAPLPFLATAEGGQSSTGAALQWARRLFGSEEGGGRLAIRM